MQAGTSLDRAKSGLGIGLALVRTLGALHSGSVTAARYGREEDRARAAEAGCDVHLTKPLSETRRREVLASMGERV